MTSTRLESIVERKALLVTRAQLDRTRLSLATHRIRAVVRPAGDPARSAAARPAAAMLVGLALPLLGMGRFARWLRFASFGLTAYRVASNWRQLRT